MLAIQSLRYRTYSESLAYPARPAPVVPLLVLMDSSNRFYSRLLGRWAWRHSSVIKKKRRPGQDPALQLHSILVGDLRPSSGAVHHRAAAVPHAVSPKDLKKLKQHLAKPVSARKILFDLKQIQLLNASTGSSSTVLAAAGDIPSSPCRSVDLPCLPLEDASAPVVKAARSQSASALLAARFTQLAFPSRSSAAAQDYSPALDKFKNMSEIEARNEHLVGKETAPFDRMSIFVCKFFLIEDLAAC